MTHLDHLGAKRLIWIVALSMLTLSFGFYVHGVHRVSTQELDIAIRENLPKGTDSATVIKFLEIRHIDHSEYISERRIIVGGIDNSFIGIVHEQIYLEFSFDERGKLSDHRVVGIQRSFWP